MDSSNLDIIANYLNNKLGEDEKNDFEKELISNTSLKNDTDNLNLVKQIAKRSRILNEAKLIHNQQMESSSHRLHRYSYTSQPKARPMLKN